MRAKHFISTAILLAATYNCKSADKKFAGGAPASSDDSRIKFQSYDLGCHFDEISAKLVDDSSVTSADSGAVKNAGTCEHANQYYAMLLTAYDDNRDGKLSEDELVKGEYEYKKAQVQEIDKNGDNVLSDDEIWEWRTKNLPTRTEKMTKQYATACSDLKKDDASCQALYEDRRAECRKEWEQEMEKKKEYMKPKDDGKYNQPNYPAPDYPKGDEYGAKPVVNVPIKVKVDVDVEVTKSVHYINFDYGYGPKPYANQPYANQPYANQPYGMMNH
ncbi:MAG: hypothetical protein NTY08_02390 [Proteobacteria bacterium]|nr:hypothetical protein [Pseudomonadota bacterium]